MCIIEHMGCNSGMKRGILLVGFALVGPKFYWKNHPKLLPVLRRVKMHGPNIVSPRAFLNSKRYSNFYLIKCYVGLSIVYMTGIKYVFSIAGAEDVMFGCLVDACKCKSTGNRGRSCVFLFDFLFKTVIQFSSTENKVFFSKT